MKRIYFGETSRTIHHRAGQHQRDHRSACKNNSKAEESSSWIMDHAMECHGGIHGLDPLQDIKFSNRRTHRDPLSRQVEEAALIAWGLEKGTLYDAKNQPQPIVCLNRKEEVFGPRLRFK